MNILVTGANGQLGNEMRIISKKPPILILQTLMPSVRWLQITMLMQ